MGQEHFTFWRGGSSASIIPVSADGQNVRVILQGDKDGNGASLAEFPSGTGNLIVSSLRLVENLDREPAAQWTLRNMLEYLSSYRPADVDMASGVAAGPKWSPFLEKLGLIAKPLPRSGEWDLNGMGRIILDFGTPWVVEACRRNAARLSEFVRCGGTALVLGTDDNGIELLRSLTGRPLRLTDPFLGVRDACIKAPVSWTRRSTPPVQLEVYDRIMTHQAFEGELRSPTWPESPTRASTGVACLCSHGESRSRGWIRCMASPDHSILISNWKVPLVQPGQGVVPRIHSCRS